MNQDELIERKIKLYNRIWTGILLGIDISLIYFIAYAASGGEFHVGWGGVIFAWAAIAGILVGISYTVFASFLDAVVSGDI